MLSEFSWTGSFGLVIDSQSTYTSAAKYSSLTDNLWRQEQTNYENVSNLTGRNRPRKFDHLIDFWP